jgi:hypothetical protein
LGQLCSNDVFYFLSNAFFHLFFLFSGIFWNSIIHASGHEKERTRHRSRVLHDSANELSASNGGRDSRKRGREASTERGKRPDNNNRDQRGNQAVFNRGNARLVPPKVNKFTHL